MKATIYKDIYQKTGGYYVEIPKLLDRIRNGKSQKQVMLVRSTSDENARKQYKSNLPSVCFSGTFRERFDNCLIDHSGFICCDVDELPDLETTNAVKDTVFGEEFVYAAWISPSGNGVKFLVKIADPKRHRFHFDALTEYFKNLPGKWDTSSVNESRVCFESWDPDLYHKEECTAFAKLIETVKEQKREFVDTGDSFKKLLTWLSNKGKSFQKGERNNFIFRLAGACCRFGISQENCYYYCEQEFIAGDKDFSQRECKATIASAYRTNAPSAGSATFDRDVLVDKITSGEVEIELPSEIFDENIKPQDIIYARDVRVDIMRLYKNGYEQVEPIGVQEIDKHFKMKKGEVTLLSGIGNMGKSQIEKWFLLMHAILYNRKFAIFAPEDSPVEEFYNDYIEILLGADCVADAKLPNKKRPSEEIYQKAIEFVDTHFFFIQPEKATPTPEYIRERFLECIVKERVDGCIIDPWNQLTNRYDLVGGREDKYLEMQLAEFARFAQMNEVFFMIIAHPTKMAKKGNDYPCPDVFDLAGGAMWNNKCHNILVYHRPFNVSDPQNPQCEFHAKKIKKQKVVGKKGFSEFNFDMDTRRYKFAEGRDPVNEALRARMMDWTDWRAATNPIVVPQSRLIDKFEQEIVPYDSNEILPF